MMTAAAHAATETAIITVEDARVQGRDPVHRIATTVLVKTATTEIDVTALIGALVIMAGVGMMIDGIPSVRPLPSLLKMNGIAALCLSSNLQPACALAN